jgi:hypothetical protein
MYNPNTLAKHLTLCGLLFLGCQPALTPATPAQQAKPVAITEPSAPASAAIEAPTSTLADSRLAALVTSMPASTVAVLGPPIYKLPVTPQETIRKRSSNKAVMQDTSSVELRGFSVKLRDKSLQKKINVLVKMPANPNRSLFRYGPEVGVIITEQGCNVGVATEALISWSCGSQGILSTDRIGQDVGNFHASNYLLVGGELKALTLDDLLIPGWEKTLSPLVEAMDIRYSGNEFLITEDGLTFYWDPSQGGTSAPSEATLSYKALASLLKPGGPISMVQRATDAPEGYFDKVSKKIK